MSDPDMQVHLVWKDDAPRSRRDGWGVAEWFFLLIGLAAVDVFVWVNTSTVLYQAYEDWSFDQTMLGLKPSPGGFVSDELSWLFKGRPKVETSDLAHKIQPL